jgi:hypothetical protein
MSDVERIEIDPAVVEVLYGGLDDDARESLLRELEGSGQDEILAEVRDLQKLFATLPNEEPPPALSAQLMAAAAEASAPAKTEGRFSAWLATIFRPLVSYPGLAAAASLVLVAGVVGTMMLGGNAKVAQPELGAVAEPTLAVPNEKVSEEKKAAADSKEEAPADDDFDTMAQGFTEAAETEIAEGTVAKAEPPPAARPAKKRPTKAKPQLATTAGTKTRARAPAGSGQGKGGGQSLWAGGKGGGDRNVGADLVRGNVQADVTSAETAKKPSASPKDKSESELHRLTAQAVKLAKKGDCRRALELGSRIRKLDRSYYERVFSSKAEIRSCLRQRKQPANNSLKLK